MMLPAWLPVFWLKVISQPWEGDVTMVLPSMVWQIKKAISNPSQEEMYQSCQQVCILLGPPRPHLVGLLTARDTNAVMAAPRSTQCRSGPRVCCC